MLFALFYGKAVDSYENTSAKINISNTDMKGTEDNIKPTKEFSNSAASPTTHGIPKTEINITDSNNNKRRQEFDEPLSFWEALSIIFLVKTK